jgi:hypothetical protein
MNIIEDKYILLRTKRPHLVTEKVSDYRIIKKDDDGFYELSVKWEQAESEALASIRRESAVPHSTRLYVDG